MPTTTSRKPLLALAALCLTTLAPGPSPAATAAPRAGAYAATLAAPLAAPRQKILDGALWKCAGDSCAAPAEGSRPVLVCARVAAEFGAVARFTTPDGALEADKLARCNAAK